MNCVKTLFITALLLFPTIGYADDLWSLEELTILAFDSRDVEILADEDNRGIRLVFDKWSDATEKEIQTTLKDTEIIYRLYPNRQAQMTVELFSGNATLKFNMKQQQKTVQIIVGNARPELQAIEVLLDPEAEVPVSEDVKELLKKGDLAGARTAVLIATPDKPAEKELAKQRINVMEAGLRGSVADECDGSGKSFSTPEGREAAFLLTWCYFSKGEVEKAEQVLTAIQEYVEDEPVIARVERKRRQILIFSLLNYARTDHSALLGNTFARFAEEFLAKFFSVNILESVATNLIRLGLGSVLCAYSDEIMAKFSNDQLKQAAPALAESYLNAGQYVQAQDAASYFLEKPLQPWARGRLLRVRAHVNLQEGNWKDAIADFEAADRLIILSPTDQLAMMESYVREAQAPQTQFELPSLQDNPISIQQNAFAERLRAEARLQQGKTLALSELKMLPDHALYQALKVAKLQSKTINFQRITTVLAERKSSWAALASLDAQIDKMQTKLATELRKRMEP